MNLRPPPVTNNNNKAYISADLAFLSHLNQQKPIHQPPKLISGYIHKKRIMPAGSPYPGLYDIYKGPYIIEMCDNMSPFSPVRYQALKKGVQVFGTTVAENVIAYNIGGRPAKVLYISATDALLQLFSTDKIDPLIDSCGLRHLISDQSEAFHTRKTGDKTKHKSYPGGLLSLTSAQSAPLMRATSYQFVLLDEIDGAPAQLKTGEGNFIAVAEGRIEAYGSRGKMFFLSTPTLYGDSLIDLQYEKGDKRFFMVPCPYCKKVQYLDQGDDKSNYGLKGDYAAGVLETGYYLCCHCHDAIFDHQKHFMLKNGHWEPSVTPKEKNFRSYWLPSFYSPPGMTSFTKMKQKHDEAEAIGDDGLRSYTNLYLGLSFEPTGERPDLKTVIDIRSSKTTGYKSGTIPKDILFLTMSADVQKGKDKWKKYSTEEINGIVKRYEDKKQFEKIDAQHFPRLEVEVCGHGRDHRTASIIYKKFYGQLSDHTSGAWKKFTEWRNQDLEGLKFYREDGFEFAVQVLFIDSGWKPNEKFINVVYNYCQGQQNTYPIKGAGKYRTDKQEQYDITTSSESDIKRFKRSETSENRLIIIQGVYYKEWIYKNFQNNDPKADRQPPNTHITPSDYPDSYFDGLRAEKQKADTGDFYNPQKKANEPLDLLVYNKCARDLHMQNLVIRLQAIAIQNQPGLANYRKDYKLREKLNQVAGEKQVIKNMELELRHNGWGPVITSKQYDELYY